MLGAGGIKLPPTGQKVVVDEANDVEAISHDLGIGKVLADQGAVNAGQVHADDPHAILAWQFRQVVLQGRFAAPQYHIEDLVCPQVAEGSRVAIFPGKEVLIDAEHPGACGTASFGILALQVILEPAFDSGSTDIFPPPQAAAVHPVIMRHKHAPAEWLGGPFVRQDAGKALPKRPAAVFATELAGFQFQDAVPQAPTVVPRLPPPPVLEP